MPKRKMGHGERMYDMCVLLGLNPVPWQFEFLQKQEQRAIDEQFAAIAAAASPSYRGE